MNKLWQFALQMLHYKRLLFFALLGALFDAACAFGGFGALIWMFKQVRHFDQPMRETIRQSLQNDTITSIYANAPGLADYFPRDNVACFAAVMGILLGVTILGSIGRFIHQYFSITVALRVIMRVRRDIYHRLIHMPMAIIINDGTSDKLSRILADTARLARAYTSLLGKYVRDFCQGVAFLIWAFIIDWQLSATFLIGVPVILIFIRKFGKHVRRATRRALQQTGKMVGAIQEALQALRVVKVHGGEGYERRRFNTINRRVLAEEMSARTARALTSPIVESIAIAAVMGVATFAVWLVYEHGRNIDDLAMVLMALAIAGMTMKPIGNLNNNLQEAAAAADRIDEILSMPVEPCARGLGDFRGKRLALHQKFVKFENVFFQYDGTEEPALRGVNLTVPHGNVCAIVGGNGSGKSTLLNLLPRLYGPTSGRVLIDGQDIGLCSLRSVRRQIAMVTQETVLFDGSIRDNIAYGARHATVEKVEAAAKRAYAHEFISQLADGYDALVGERGSRLSGGQRQRIAIARAILHEPAILILDEATSQIDADSEAKINEALSQFVQDRTTFVIAHRLSTVVNADTIVVLHDGLIEATGKHNELLENCAIYQTLCQTQLHSADTNHDNN